MTTEKTNSSSSSSQQTKFSMMGFVTDNAPILFLLLILILGTIYLYYELKKVKQEQKKQRGNEDKINFLDTGLNQVKRVVALMSKGIETKPDEKPEKEQEPDPPAPMAANENVEIKNKKRVVEISDDESTVSEH